MGIKQQLDRIEAKIPNENNIINAITAALESYFATLRTFIESYFGSLKALIEAIKQILLELISRFFNPLGETNSEIKLLLQEIRAAINYLHEGVQLATARLLQRLDAIDNVLKFITEFIQSNQARLLQRLDAIDDVLAKIWGLVNSIIQDLTAIAGVIIPALAAIQFKLGEISSFIAQVKQEILDKIVWEANLTRATILADLLLLKAALAAIALAVVTTIPGAIAAISAAIARFVASIESKLIAANFKLDRLGQISSGIKNAVEIPFDSSLQVKNCDSDTPEVISYNGQGFAGVHALVKALSQQVNKAISSTCNIKKEIEPVAAFPDWWQVRLGANRPQLVLTFLVEGTNTYHSLCVPHPADPNAVASAPIGEYQKGNWQGEIVCKDNSKFIANCSSKEEAQRVVDRALQLIAPAFLEFPPRVYISERKGQAVGAGKMIPTTAQYFPTGQKSSTPAWRVNLRKLT